MPKRTDAEIEVLVHAFEECTLTAAEWTHREHLTVALYYLRHDPTDEAMDRNRRYKPSHGNTTGYHETVTLAWIAVICRFLAEHGNGQPLSTIVRELRRFPVTAPRRT